MAITIIATPGAVDANSYVTLAEAETISEGFVNRSTWDAATDETKNSALVQATNDIDSLSLMGISNGQQDDSGGSNYQPLHFPVNNKTYIPQSVKVATTDQAMAIIRNGAAGQKTSDIINAGIEEQKTSRYEAKYNKSWATGGVSPTAKRYLGGWLSRTVRLEFSP